VVLPGADRAIQPRPLLVADNGGALQEIVIHFTPVVQEDVAPTYRDLLRAIEPHVKVWVVVENEPHYRRFTRLLDRWGVQRPDRFRPVLVHRPITTWSRDRYSLVVQGARRRLLVRPRPQEGPAPRRNDWHAPFALARTVGGDVKVKPVPLIFDGGDLIATGRHVFATALLQARNEEGTLAQRPALSRWLRHNLGREPVLLGRRADRVPGHHIGMFVTPLSDCLLHPPTSPDCKSVVLVGDVASGLALLPGEAELPLAVDRTAATAARFQLVARELRARGFTVVRVPLVPLSDGLTYLTYNNVLLERRADGRLHGYVPQFGLAGLDRAGRAAFERQGVVVHPIDVSRIYTHNGTVRCLVNVLRRAG